MRTFRLIAVSVVFAAIFAVSALAQAPTNTKIGLIDSRFFEDDKAGLTKYVAALNSLDKEFQPVSTELTTMATKVQALEKEINTLREQAQKGTVPVNEASFNAKVEEREKLIREYKFKEEGAKANFERRRQVVLGPILRDIGTAIQEFTKKNGYVMIIDISKDNTGIILGVDEGADVTKQFITFYNARPATTATVTK